MVVAVCGKPDVSWLQPTAHRDRWREVMNLIGFFICCNRGAGIMMIITEDGVIVIAWS